MRANRKTRVQPSQATGRKPSGKNPATATRSPTTPRHRRAIKRHNRGDPRATYPIGTRQLRHTRADELEDRGLDVPGPCLGHRSPVLTEHYAGLDVAAAVE